MVVETRFFRSDVHTVNGLSAYQLKNVNSTVLTSVSSTYQWWGIRVFIRHSDGSEEEVTTGTPVAVVLVTVPGWYNASWNCPSKSLNPTDAIVVRLYSAAVSAGPWVLAREWISEQLNASRLDSSMWKVYYNFDVVERVIDGTVVLYLFRHGSPTYNSRIEDFAYTPYVPIVLTRVYGNGLACAVG